MSAPDFPEPEPESDYPADEGEAAAAPSGPGTGAGLSGDSSESEESAEEGAGEGEGEEESSSGEAPQLDELFLFSYQHRVRYDEVDAQGVVGNATWLNILQLARVEYLRNIGMLGEGGTVSPVQAVVRRSVVDYLAPARFDDTLLLRVRCAYLGNSSARFEYLVDLIESGLRTVVGETVLICLDMERFCSTPWPQLWRDRVIDYEEGNVQLGQG